MSDLNPLGLMLYTPSFSPMSMLVCPFWSIISL